MLLDINEVSRRAPSVSALKAEGGDGARLDFTQAEIAMEVKMGCGCGKKFSKTNVNIPTPASVLAEAARRMAEKKNGEGMQPDKTSEGEEK